MSQIENYFMLAIIQNENLKARFAIILLNKCSAIKLYSKGYNLQTLTWQQFKMVAMIIFKPADYHRHTCDKLAVCVQKALTIG